MSQQQMPLEGFFKQAWRRSAGMKEHEIPKKLPSPVELDMTEWSKEFERLMKNRLIMGAMRYGTVESGNGKGYDAIPSAIAKLQQFSDTGNLEYLVDVANICLLVHTFRKDDDDTYFEAADDTEHIT